MDYKPQIGDIITNYVEQSPCWTIIKERENDGDFVLGQGVGMFHLSGLQFGSRRVVTKQMILNHYTKIGFISIDCKEI